MDAVVDVVDAPPDVITKKIKSSTEIATTVNGIPLPQRCESQRTTLREIYNEIDEFSRSCRYTAGCARTKATCYYVLAIGMGIYVILASLILSFISIFDMNKYAISAMGFSIAAAKTFLTVFKLEKRVYNLTSMAHQLTRISRQLKKLKSLNLSLTQINERIDAFYDEVDALELQLLDLSGVEETPGSTPSR